MQQINKKFGRKRAPLLNPSSLAEEGGALPIPLKRGALGEAGADDAIDQVGRHTKLTEHVGDTMEINTVKRLAQVERYEVGDDSLTPPLVQDLPHNEDLVLGTSVEVICILVIGNVTKIILQLLQQVTCIYLINARA